MGQKRGATRMQLLADADNQPALGYYRHLEWQETAWSAGANILRANDGQGFPTQITSA
jgi:ribosomal protein S18 acetylase RimI-like enzyme